VPPSFLPSPPLRSVRHRERTAGFPVSCPGGGIG
jgi:hypothetical protein